VSYITAITDHVAKALALVLSQFSAPLGPYIRELVSILADEVQELEDVVDDCYTERLLSTSVGMQLDAYGKVLAFARNGLSDDDYRAVLQVRIAANRGSGTIPPILLVVATVLAAFMGQGVRYIALYPAGYSIGFVLDVPSPEVTDGLRAALVQLMLEMRPAGVSMELRETVEAAPEGDAYFTFDTDTSPNAGGFNHTPPALWNTRVLSPVTTSWPFPVDSMVAVYALSDRASWASEDPTDGLDVASWPAASMSADGAAGLVYADASGSDYQRLGGTVYRGSILHAVGNIEPYKLDDGSVTWFDGQFTLHVRMKLTTYDATVDGIVTQWDPIGDGRCGLFVDSVTGLYWEEDPKGVVCSAALDTDWHTITVVRDATDVTIYVDRVEEASGTHGGVDALNGEPPLIGARNTTNGSTTGPGFDYGLDGQWSVVAIYSAAQGSSELSQAWDAIDALDGVIAA